ncbi:MAG: S8 family serine peptidase [archaeon YNP-WB-062]|jgi:subtilisin family serine protease|nr:S8 family serine peptidase [Candidatus Culexarchaeum yellowstonense]
MRKSIIALFIIISAVALIPPATAKPPLTLPHRYTWDADLINAEIAHQMGYTGKGVYIAVLDTGLVPNWKDYFPEDRIATKLGKGFYEPIHVDPKTGELVYAGFVVETSWIGSTLSTHGTHVVSTIIGYNYYAPQDAAAGLPLPPIFVEGIAPDATIIPIKVLTTYNLPPYTGPDGLVFGTDLAVAAGIKYATELKLKGYSPMIISMSLGGPEPSDIIEDAIKYAIENGVIVVAAAGNDGSEGMDWPGAYPEVISVGACGWKYEWYWPDYAAPPPRYRLWWLQDVADPTNSDEIYVTDFSGRENDYRVPGYDQELDVLAPGSWVRGPYPGYPGYNHLPWWAPGRGWIKAPPNLANFYYLSGTSMATPHVSAVAALMLQKNPDLSQSEVEGILKSTALSISPGSMTVFDYGSQGWGWYTYEWDKNATGAGLIQADKALERVSSYTS